MGAGGAISLTAATRAVGSLSQIGLHDHDLGRAAVVVVCTQGAESSLIGLISPILSEARQKRGKREGALILLLPPPWTTSFFAVHTLTKEQIGCMAGQGFPDTTIIVI